MTEAAEEAAPWWDGAQAGARTPVALIRVELTEPMLPAEGLPDEVTLRRRARYAAGIAYVARAFGAAQPLSWEGSGVTLVVGGCRAQDLPVKAFQVAQELWLRTRIELDLPARIASHVAVVPWGAEGLAAEQEAVFALLKLARPGAVAVSEDLALMLPPEARRQLSLLGVAAGAPAYVFPADLAPEGVATPRLPDDDRLWNALRAYASVPEVRLVRYPGFRLGKRPHPLDVREVFVAPDLEIRPAGSRATDRVASARRHGHAPAGALREDAAHEYVLSSTEALAAHPSLVVLGDPGAGKSTLLRWLAITAAGGRFACAAAFHVSQRLLPIPVSLGRLAEVRRGHDAEPPATLLARYLRDRGVGDGEYLAPALHRELEAGSGLLLLDGLDEARAEDHPALRRFIEALAEAYPQSRLVVTSRIVGYPGLALPAAADAILRPFDDGQIERAARALLDAAIRWETGQHADPGGEAARLMSAIRSLPGPGRLAGNPFALAILVLIHRAEGKLPRHRVHAYEVFARELCETWAQARRIVAEKNQPAAIDYEEEALPILGQLALAIHEQYPTGLASEAFFVATLTRALQEQRGFAASAGEQVAQEFLRRAAEEVQVLAERGPGEWGFLHLTLQEFFVAAGLHAAERFEEAAVCHLFDPRWEEVLRLGVGYLALVQKRPVAAGRLVERVLCWDEPEPRACITGILRLQIPLAALLAAEAGDALPLPLQERVAAAFADWAAQPPTPDAPRRYLDEIEQTDFFAVLAKAIMDEEDRKGAGVRGGRKGSR